MPLKLSAYKNKDGEPANWDDYLWIAIDPNTQKSYSFYFLNPHEVQRPHVSISYGESQILLGCSGDLAKCYTLDLVTEQGFKRNTQKKMLAAKEILSKIDGLIWQLTQDKLDELSKGVKADKLNLYRPFIQYCHKQGFLAKNVLLKSTKTKDSSAEAAIERQYDRMPDDQVILATASIFHTIVPHINDTIDVMDNVRDRFVSCMTALALASPNRMAVEQLALNNQQLQTKLVKQPKKDGDTQVLDENGKKIIDEHLIHWLDWQGSKGHKDNRNHMLACMAQYVKRALNYFDVVCEPARVLCRYYTNPNAKLENILGQYQPKNLHNLSLDKPVNLFQLGGLLGFYDNVDFSKLNGFPFTADIYQEFKWTTSNANILLCTSTNQGRDWLPFRQEQMSMTLAELESLWLAHIKASLPSFPYRYQGDSGSRVKLEHAMCVFTGAQLKVKKPSFLSGGSPFFVESINLEELSYKVLKPGGIFQRNGFADSFTIRPHQFRHYLNTKCQDSELPELVIAMFSGRVKVESNADYDHVPDSQHVTQIAHIHTAEQAVSVKVHTQEQYEKATGKAAHIMSTGMCVQQLHQNPCSFLNDFLTQCAGCRRSCHINRDMDAIKLLEQDLAIQKVRLEEVKNNPSLKTNPLRQRWFTTHHSNMFVLEELITLMKSKDIKKGSLIRYAGDESAFQLIDIEKRERIEHKVSLPNSKEALDALLLDLKADKKPKGDGKLNNLLAKLGVAV